MRRLLGVALVFGAIAVPSWPARAETTQAEIRDNAYFMAEITTNEGDTVTWTDLGNNPHSVTSDDGRFDSHANCSPLPLADCMANGDAFDVTFPSADTYKYHCRVHGQDMVGTVIVKAPSTTTTTTTTLPTTTSAGTNTSVDDQPTVTQAALPSIPPTSGVALPKSIIRSRDEDDLRPLVIAAVAIAGTTIIAGIVLVRRGRVPFG